MALDPLKLEIIVDDSAANNSLDGIKEKSDTIHDNIKAIDTLIANKDFMDWAKGLNLSDQVTSLHDSFKTIEHSLSRLQKSAIATGGMLSDAYGRMYTDIIDNTINAQHTFQQLERQYARQAKGRQVTINQAEIRNKAAYVSANAKQHEAMLDEFSKFKKGNKSIGGWKFKDLKERAPVLVPIVSKLVTETQASSRGAKSYDLLSAMVSKKGGGLREVLESYSGKAMSDADAKDITRMIMYGWGSRLGINDYRKFYKDPNITHAARAYSMEDRLPEQFRNTYSVLKRGGSRVIKSSGSTEANIDVPKQLLTLITGGQHQRASRQGQVLLDILKDVGIASVHDKKLHLNQKMTQDEANMLGYRLIDAFAASKRGQFGYMKDINSSEIAGRIYRDNNTAALLSDAMEALTGVSLTSAMVENFQKRAHHGMKQYHGKMDSVGGNQYYYIPSTRIDETGKLKYTDPNGYRFPVEYKRMYELSHSDKQEDHDLPFISVAGSQFTRRLGMHGSGTLGHGRDSDYNPIAGPSKLIQVYDPSMFVTDPKSGRITDINMQKAGQYKDFFDYSKGMDFNGEKYVYAYQNGKKWFGIRKSDYDAMTAQDIASAYASGFNNYNIFGFNAASTEKTMGQVDLSRKRSTPTVSARDAFGIDDSKIRKVIWNTEALYDALGIQKNDVSKGARIDGLALLNPHSISGQSVAAQIRDAGVIKAMLQTMDVPKLLKDSGMFSLQSRGGMVTTNNGKQQIWMPSMVATAQDVIDLMELAYTDKNGNRVAMTPQQAEALRREKFFDINDSKNGIIYTDTTVKNLPKFRYMELSAYKRMLKDNGIRYKKPVDYLGNSRIISGEQYGDLTGDIGNTTAEYRKQQQIVRLTAKESEMLLRATSENEGGIGIANMADDFQSRKEFLSHSAFMAIGAPNELLEQSRQNYARRLQELDTFAGVRKYVIEGNRALEKKMSVIGEEGMREDAEVQQLAEEYKQTLIRKRDYEQQILLGKDGIVENLVATLSPKSILEAIVPAVTAGGVGDLNPTDAGLKEILSDAEDVVYASTSINKARAITGRNPASPGTLIDRIVKNRGSGMKYLRKLGFGNNQAVFSTFQQFQHNTGDFDGDTVLMLRSFQAQAFQNVIDRMREQNAQIETADNEIRRQQAAIDGEIKKPKLNQYSAFGPDTDVGDRMQAALQGVMGYSNSQIDMGAAFNAMEKAIRLPSSDPRKFTGMAQAIKAYDEATVEFKRGTPVEWEEYAQAYSILLEGRQFEKMLSQIGAFSGSGETPDNLSVFKAMPIAMNDVNGMAVMLANQKNILEGATRFDNVKMMRDFVNKAYDKNYDSKLYEAWQWYADIYDQNVFGQKLYTNEDIQKGHEHLQALQQEFAELSAVGEADLAEQLRGEIANLQRVLDFMSNRGMSRENVTGRMEELARTLQDTNLSAEDREEYQSEFDMLSQLLQNESQASENTEKYKLAMDTQFKEREKQRIELRKKIEEIAKAETKEAADAIDISNIDVDALVKGSSSAITTVLNYMENLPELVGINYTNPGSGASKKIDLLNSDPDIMKTINNAKNRAESQANELRRVLGMEVETNPDAVFGSVIHNVIDDYVKGFSLAADPSQYLKDNNIADMVVDFIQNGSLNGKTVQELFEKQGIYFTKGANGENVLNSIYSSQVSEKFKDMMGGGLQNLLNNPVFDTALYELIGREGMLKRADGTFTDTPLIHSGNGLYKDSRIMFDAIARNKNTGKLQLIDWKPSTSASKEAIYQTMAYVSDINDVVKEALIAADEGRAHPFAALAPMLGGWKMTNGQYDLDANGKKIFESYFDSVRSVNYRTGESYDYAFTEDELEAVRKSREAGSIAHRKANETLNREGVPLILKELQQRKTVQEKIDALKDEVYGEGYQRHSEADVQFAAQQYAKDGEILSEMQKEIYKERRKYGDVGFGGYNRFAQFREAVQGTQDSETLKKVIEQYTKDSPIFSEIFKRSMTKASLLSEINQLELASIMQDPKNYIDSINRSLYGSASTHVMDQIAGMAKKRNDHLVAINDVRNNNEFRVRENRRQLTSDAVAALDIAEKEHRELEDKITLASHEVVDRGIRSDTNELNKALAPFIGRNGASAIRENVDKYVNNITDYIEQRSEIINQIQKKLKDTDAIKEGSTERIELERYLNELIANRQKAVDFKNSDEYKNAERQALANYYRQQYAGLEYSKIQRDNRNYQYAHRFDNSSFTRHIIEQRREYAEAIKNAPTLEKDYEDTQRAYNTLLGKQEKGELDEFGLKDLDIKRQQIENLSAAMQENQNIINNYESGSATFAAAMDTMTEKVSNFMRNIGNRVFRMAIQEARQFTLQFSAAMTEIQEITLKSGDEIEALGDKLIKVANEMKTPIKNVTDTATALYRQGLSDEQMSHRLDEIIKFATVSNVKAESATRLGTVAINGQLVNDVSEIYDVVSAISDSAATDPDAITKAYQRSAYAAKAAGVTSNELVSMAAAITSLTQLSGNVAGTSLSNYFSRMRKVTTKEIDYDDEGNKISRNEVAKALQLADIELMPGGKMISATDMLRQLGSWWKSSNATDVTRNAIANALAGSGRQASNFLALMEAFSETNEQGELLIDTFLGIADASAGIVDEKFKAYMESLNASITNFRNAFDSLVQSFSKALPIKDLFNFLADSLSGLKIFVDLISQMGDLPSILFAIAAGLAAISVSFERIKGAAGFFSSFTGNLTTIGKILTVLSAVISAGALINSFISSTKKETSHDAELEKIDTAEKAYKKAESLSNKRDHGHELTAQERDELITSVTTLQNLGYVSDEVASKILGMGTNAEGVADALLEAKNRIELAKKEEELKENAKIFSEENVNTSSNRIGQRGSQTVSLATKYMSFLAGGQDIFANDEERDAAKESFKTIVGYIFDSLKLTDSFKQANIYGFDDEDDFIKFLTSASYADNPDLFNVLFSSIFGENYTDVLNNGYSSAADLENGLLKDYLRADQSAGRRTTLRDMMALGVAKIISDANIDYSNGEEIEYDKNVIDKAFTDYVLDKLDVYKDDPKKYSEYGRSLTQDYETLASLGKEFFKSEQAQDALTESSKSLSEQLMNEYSIKAEEARKQDKKAASKNVAERLKKAKNFSDLKNIYNDEYEALSLLRDETEFVKEIDAMIQAGEEGFSATKLETLINQIESDYNKIEGFKSNEARAAETKRLVNILRSGGSWKDFGWTDESAAKRAEDIISTVGYEYILNPDKYLNSDDYINAMIAEQQYGVTGLYNQDKLSEDALQILNGTKLSSTFTPEHLAAIGGVNGDFLKYISLQKLYNEDFQAFQSTGTTVEELNAMRSDLLESFTNMKQFGAQSVDLTTAQKFSKASEEFDKAIKGQTKDFKYLNEYFTPAMILELAGGKLDESELGFARQFMRGTIMGGQKYSAQGMSTGLMSMFRDNLIGPEWYDQQSEIMKMIYDDLTGGMLSQYVENVRIGADKNLLNEQSKSMFSTLVENITTDKDVIDWIARIQNSDLDPSAYWDGYNDLASRVQESRKLGALLKQYRVNPTDEDIISQLANLGIDETTLRTNKETAIAQGESKIKQFDDKIAELVRLILMINGINIADLSGLNDEELGAALEEKLNDASYHYIENLGLSMSEMGNIVSNQISIDPITKSIQDIINESARAIEQKSASTNYNKLNDLFNKNKGYGNFVAALETATTGDNADLALRNFIANDSTFLARMSAYQNGYMTDEEMAYYLNTSRFGAYGDDIRDYSPYMRAITGSSTASDLSGLSFEEFAINMQGIYNTSPTMFNDIVEWLSEFEDSADVIAMLRDKMSGLNVETGRANRAMLKLGNSMKIDLNNATNRGSVGLEKTNELLKDQTKFLNGDVKAITKYINEFSEFNDRKYYLQQYTNGANDKQTLATMSSMTGIDEGILKTADAKQRQSYINMGKAVVDFEDIEWTSSMDNMLEYLIPQAIEELQANIDPNIDLGTFYVNGSWDINAFINALNQLDSAVAQQLIQLMNGWTGLGGTIGLTLDENGKLTVNTSTGSMGSKRSGRSSGGGGGGKGKSDSEKLIEKLKHGQSLYEHQIKMAQYEETRYQNLDELTNYARVLQEEIKLEKSYLPVLEDNIKALKAQMASVSEGSEDWYKLRDAVLAAEEKYAEITNTIDENNKKLRENQQAIRKLHTNLEDMVVAEIKARIQRQRDMLAGNVNMQKTILDSIKNRYQKEWDLIKQDIDRKKKALEEEKSLIDERLQRRRNAEDQALQYEQLAELKRQYASISMDSSRTKDAANLRKQIQDMERSLGWDMAEAEATALSDAIQDQIDAYDEFASTGDEDLDKLLEDANNFGEEVKRILGMSHDDLMIWLQSNDESYRNSLSEAQQQILNDWDDTWKQMYGIVDTWWPQVQEILSSESSFIDFMSQSVDYLNSSFDAQASSIYEWTEAYQQWMKALIDTAEWMHNDFGVGSWTGKEYNPTSTGGNGTGTTGATIPSTNNSNGRTVNPNAKKYVELIGSTLVGFKDIDGSIIDAISAPAMDYNQDNNGKVLSNTTSSVVQNYLDSLRSSIANDLVSSSSTAATASSATTKPSGHGYYYQITQDGKVVYGPVYGFSSREAAQAEAKKKAKAGQKYSTKYYLHGGEADFTGPIMIDGTPQLPERILSAEQTEAFNKLTDVAVKFDRQGVLDYMNSWSTFSSISPYMTQVASDDTYNNTVNVGDINIALYEAKLEDDADYDTIATKVGQKFAKELSKQGVRVAFNL